jgi:hypothetical protein
MTTAVVTVVARNTLAHARILAGGAARFAPDATFYAVLADEPDAGAAEPFPVIPWTALAVPHEERWRFRYAQPDLCYAATPWAIAHLLDRGHDRVLFLKQETMIIGALAPLLAALGAASILLTPHLLAPLPGPGGRARELEVLLAGAYNVGVLGVAAGATARRFLTWWSERLARRCRREVGGGMHYEQRWIDFVPAFFPDVHIARDPGWNLGHWSLPERRVERDGERFMVDGAVLRIVRFSGHEPERPEWVTSHNRRLTTAALGPAGELFARYRDALKRADDGLLRGRQPAWTRFDDGSEIPAIVRAAYRDLADQEVDRFGDPFTTSGPSFRSFLDASDDGVPRLWRYVHHQRLDLQRAFPDISGADKGPFLAWTTTFGRREYGEEARR